jgi:hypothetical protein
MKKALFPFVPFLLSNSWLLGQYPIPSYRVMVSENVWSGENLVFHKEVFSIYMLAKNNFEPPTPHASFLAWGVSKKEGHRKRCSGIAIGVMNISSLNLY